MAGGPPEKYGPLFLSLCHIVQSYWVCQHLDVRDLARLGGHYFVNAWNNGVALDATSTGIYMHWDAMYTWYLHVILLTGCRPVLNDRFLKSQVRHLTHRTSTPIARAIAVGTGDQTVQRYASVDKSVTLKIYIFQIIVKSGRSWRCHGWNTRSAPFGNTKIAGICKWEWTSQL